MLGFVLRWLAALAPAVQTVSTPAPAPPPPAHLGIELRAGGQLPRSFPAAALYAWTDVTPEWSAGLGYEAVRTYEVALPKTCETLVKPVVAAGLRGGAWRRVRLGHGLSLRGGLLVGAGAPALAAGAFPKGVSGGVAEAALDLQATYSFHALDMSLYATPTLAVGSFSSEVCGGAPAQADVRDVGLHVGIGLGVRL